jgi:hypothetical protein
MRGKARGRKAEAIMAGLRRAARVVIILLALGGAARELRAAVPDLIERLGNVTNATAFRYGARDDRGAPLDCLKILQLGPGEFIGVYHAQREKVFHLHVARSTNLLEWRRVATLDEHASQGTLWRGSNGVFLVAYEKDTPRAANVRLRHYENLAALLAGRFTREFDVPRTLAPSAEGTPSFERVEWGGVPERSRIELRLHYYRDRKVDRAATGTLVGFTNWVAAPDPAINAPLETRGVQGNIGDRDRFEWGGRGYLLQEAQMKPRDWTSWRLFLFDAQTMELWPVPVRTHLGSRSFANPTVTPVRDAHGRGMLAVTLFLPAQGSAPGEAGTLIYVVPASAPAATRP